MTPKPIATQIRRLQLGVAEISGAVTALPPGALLDPLGNWSPRDIVAHLIGWNRAVVRGCRQLLQGEMPFYDIDPGKDYSNINAQLVATYASTDRAELLSELAASAAEVEQFALSVSEHDWKRDSGVRHQEEVLTVGATISELIDDYFHHLGQIQGLAPDGPA